MNANLSFAQFMLAFVVKLAERRKPDESALFNAKIFAVGVSGCQLREWRRAEDVGLADRELFDAAAIVADPFVKEASRSIRRFISGFFEDGR